MAAPANVRSYSGPVPPVPRQNDWRSGDQFVLRLAGFGFELLQSLGFEQTIKHLEMRPDFHALKRCFDDELQSKRRLLWEIAGRPDFLEALLLSNPEACYRVESYLKSPFPSRPNSAQTRIERLITTYLQRFCAKNDSASFFGPITYGAVAESTGLEGNLSGALAERKVRISHWAANAIRRALAGNNEPVPTQTWDTLAFLPQDCCPSELENLRALVCNFHAGGYQERKLLLQEINSAFTTITGQAPYRNEGMPYGDRMVISEECRYDAGRLRLASSVITALTRDYSVLFDVIAFPGRLRIALERVAFNQLCKSVWEKQSVVSYSEVLDFLRRCPEAEARARQQARAAWQQQITPYLAAIHGLLIGHTDDGILHLSPDEFIQIKKQACTDVSGWPFFCAPDVLLATPSMEGVERGDYSIVLGEIHSSVGINGYYASVHPDQEGLRREIVSAITQIAGHRQPVGFVTPAFNKTFSDLDLPFPVMQQDGTAAPGSCVVNVSDLMIHFSGGGLELVHPQYGPVFLYSKMPHVMGLYPLCLFGVAPCGMREFKRALLFGRSHIPRLQLGRLTILRETWMVPLKHMLHRLSAEPLQAFCSFRDWGKTKGWPRHLFARWDAAEKPVFLDMENWLLLKALLHRLSRSPAPSVELSEMLPGPGELWLKDRNGSHTSEFRILMYPANEAKEPS